MSNPDIDSNGTTYTSDSEHADFDIRSNSSVSSVEDTRIKTSALIETLYGIQMFTDSLQTVKKYKFGRYTIDLADAGARKVSDLAKPVSYRFSDQIERADKIAAASVQTVKESTDKIFSTLKEPAIQTISTVKQYQEQLGCTIEDNITTPGSRFVMNVDSRLTPFVDVIEDILQRVIPDEKDENSREIRDDQNEQQQIAQTLRVLQIALATRDRCVEKMRKQITTTQSYTSEQLRLLQESNQLLSRATENINTLNRSLLGMAVNLRESVQNPDLAVTTLQAHLQSITAVIYKDEDNLPKAVQARIIDCSKALLDVTDGISNYIKLNAQHSPEYLQERLKPLVTFFEERYSDIVNEINNGKGSPFEKAKNIFQLTTNQVLPLLRSSLSDLQEAFQCYTNSLNTSFQNQFVIASQTLGVK